MGDDLREIVTMGQMNGLLLSLAILSPVVGVIYFMVYGKKSSDASETKQTAIVIGVIGPFALVMWKVYNAITARLGLDSVKNLVVNLVLFVAIGIAAGLFLSRKQLKRSGEPVPVTDVEKAENA
ncbi:MAG: hypothetical protein ABJA67_09655 [Chthonomonadales bacterium]